MSRRRAQQLRSAPTTPPAELKDPGTETETMSEGELVHCVCNHAEGDGMMVQCESCLTWQHGQCLGIDIEGQVPDKYICSVCLAPSLGRQSAFYSLDMDWIREGRLASLGVKNMEQQDVVKEELKTLCDLMADLVNLSSVLHSLQVKLAVAGQKNNPKVFMWSNVWDEGGREGEADDFLKKCDKSESSVPKNGLINCTDQKAVNGGVIDEFFDEKVENSAINFDVQPVEENILDNSSPEVSGQKHEGNLPGYSQSTKKSEPAESQTFGSDLADYFSSGGFDFPSSLLPSVSEMQRLLPGVIKDISELSSQNFSTSFLPPAPNIIPEPKRLDREECRQNLVVHIEKMQQLLLTRIEHIEVQVDLLEEKCGGKSEKVSITSTVFSVTPSLATTLQDLRSAKMLNTSLPDRI